MFTRCPGCHTVHPLNAALLVSGAGRYRCGKCNKVCNALESLFDEWPAAGARAPAGGEMPILGLSLDLAGTREARQAGADNSRGYTSSIARGTARWLTARAAWMIAAIAIVVTIAFRLAEFQAGALPERPQAGSVLPRPGAPGSPADPAFRDLDQIHLVSRELSSHPGLPGRLRLTATIVNRAAQSQRYPDIEVTLLNSTGQAVSAQRFSPRDYLAPDSPANAIMAPRAHLPLVLELDDPGEQAVGFELSFR
jgi:predicted Zn finger-like uncharacterized protein